MEVWERVRIADAFLADLHGEMTCTSCHGGLDGTLTKPEAHLGMVLDPSDGNAPACANCHSGIAQRHAASAHGTQSGYFTSFARRTGESTVSPELRSMFDAACAQCHTSCGQCHISRPVSVEGGFLSGHDFRKTPNALLNCMACHGSRVGDEFRGVHSGLPADAHYLKGMNCIFCHTGEELHGDGTTPENRYDVAGAPACLDPGCHAGIEAESGNAEHDQHLGQVGCQVCHSVPYKNCYNCHVGEGLRFPSRIDFRIGKNADPDEAHPWEYVLLRHIPISPNSFSAWGVSLPNYVDGPTWLYTSPHNIQKNTPQNESCGACHGNEELFLTAEYVDSLITEGVMVSEEIAANQAVLVEELP